MTGGLLLTFALCLATAGRFLRGEMPAAFGEALRVDGLSALVLVLCGFVGLLSAVYGVGCLRRNERRNLVTPRMRRKFYGLIPAYVFAMMLVAMSNNLGILWIAVELTTLASVFLVSFHDRDTSLEAAWKFLILGSLGLGFALLGTVLLFAAGQGQLGEGLSALHWTRFMDAAPRLHPFTLRLGVVASGIGLGAEAGGFGALLHMTYHSLAKPVSLFSAGTLAQQHSSSDFARIGTGTFTRAPIASALLVLSAVILTGSPPFGMFFSEMTILRAGFGGPHLTATSVFLAALVVLFCGFAYQIGRLLLRPPRAAHAPPAPQAARPAPRAVAPIGAAGPAPPA